MVTSPRSNRDVVESNEVMTQNLELFNQLLGSNLAKGGM
jgi:hypothetical protein